MTRSGEITDIQGCTATKVSTIAIEDFNKVIQLEP